MGQHHLHESVWWFTWGTNDRMAESKCLFFVKPRLVPWAQHDARPVRKRSCSTMGWWTVVCHQPSQNSIHSTDTPFLDPKQPQQLGWERPARTKRDGGPRGTGASGAGGPSGTG